MSSLSSDSDCPDVDKKRTAKLERLVIMLRTAVDKLKEENKNLSLERVVTNTDDKVSLVLFKNYENNYLLTTPKFLMAFILYIHIYIYNSLTKLLNLIILINKHTKEYFYNLY